MATLKSIITQMQSVVDWKDKYIPDYNELSVLVKQLKDASYKIVLTQGVWDMWHEGHVRYLAAAKKFGDILIVGIDTDELTRKLKSTSDDGLPRPFDPFEGRKEIVGSLGFVDLITRRDVDQHMYELIRTVRPDVLVLSKSTRTVKQKDLDALQKYCGRLEYLEPQASVSTTAKLRRVQIEGLRALSEEITSAVTNTIQGFLTRMNGHE